jgi:hypothetical protein
MMPKSDQPKRLFMMKGQPYVDRKHQLAGQYMSEKLDGFRFFWDGGVSRGMVTSTVPYANTAKDKKETRATGLWSQNCKVIYAPEWFLNNLPPFPLDGEIWGGRGNFQATISIGKTQDFTGDWTQVKCMVLDVPDPRIILADGEIDEPHFKKTFSGTDQWMMSRLRYNLPHPACTFRERLSWLDKNLVGNQSLELHKQVLLPQNTPKAKAAYESFMEEVLDGRGEGLILKSPTCYWSPERNHNTHKCKPYEDMEATVVGYTSGEETDKGSKLLGKMGALICKDSKGRRFKVSGFNYAERELSTSDFDPGIELPETVTSAVFPRGSVVTIRYRELTDVGIPKEARYHRMRAAGR